jgi:hypothetical protein
MDGWSVTLLAVPPIDRFGTYFLNGCWYTYKAMFGFDGVYFKSRHIEYLDEVLSID